jgi:Raf kinase inhibitor-like YbhB/YbcL family protein
MELKSSSFADGQPIPRRHTCDGEDLSPPLAWTDVPEGTTSLALIVDDPDAPRGTFTHWLGWGLDPTAAGLEEGEAAPAEGRNDFGEPGYRGPCPPRGHGPHRYFFRLHALEQALGLSPAAGRAELDAALAGSSLATAELMGTHER